MGSLHKGHISLIQKATANNTNVIVSIFINPTQFDEKQDFQNHNLLLLFFLDINHLFRVYILIYWGNSVIVVGRFVNFLDNFGDLDFHQIV